MIGEELVLNGKFMGPDACANDVWVRLTVSGDDNFDTMVVRMAQSRAGSGMTATSFGT